MLLCLSDRVSGCDLNSNRKRWKHVQWPHRLPFQTKPKTRFLQPVLFRICRLAGIYLQGGSPIRTCTWKSIRIRAQNCAGSYRRAPEIYISTYISNIIFVGRSVHFVAVQYGETQSKSPDPLLSQFFQIFDRDPDFF